MDFGSLIDLMINIVNDYNYDLRNDDYYKLIIDVELQNTVDVHIARTQIHSYMQ